MKHHSYMREREAFLRPRLEASTAEQEEGSKRNQELRATAEVYRSTFQKLLPRKAFFVL